MRSSGPWRDDLVTSLLATTLVVGLFLDGWNHINLQNGALGSFWTIWHALLYAGFNATALWVVTRNPHLYTRGRRPAPYLQPILGLRMRYPLAMFGLALATIGLFGDIVWHTAFGEEIGVARVIAPFHLFLFAGAAGLASASLRSGWYAPQFYPRESSLRTIFPPLLSLTLVTCVAAFMFQWLDGFLDWTPSLVIGRLPADLASDPRIRGTVEFAGAARVLMTNIVLLSGLLLGLRRWHLPFGSATFLFVGVSFAMSALSSFELGATVFAALVGGLIADFLLDTFRPDQDHSLGYRLTAALAPLGLWTSYFLILQFVYAIVWPFDLWLGTTMLAAFSGVLLSYVAIAPHIPALADDGTPLPVESSAESRRTSTDLVGDPSHTYGGATDGNA